eukprot:scaffold19616_cov20-Cyclotella_meneghiniana.AAC.1
MAVVIRRLSLVSHQKEEDPVKIKGQVRAHVRQVERVYAEGIWESRKASIMMLQHPEVQKKA